MFGREMSWSPGLPADSSVPDVSIFSSEEATMRRIGIYAGSLIMAFAACTHVFASGSSKEGAPRKAASAKAKSVAICTKCGEFKGTGKCCKVEGREKCAKCSLLKGSVGCCKLPKGAKSAVVCTKCGEIKGAGKCCKAEGREKCGKCSLLKGAVGCCKLPKAEKE